MAKKEPKTNSGMDIPDYAFERMAQCMLPMIQKYYESEEGQEELEKWKEQQEEIKVKGR